jgi:hyperosmotically inducible periplasmic protein
MKIKSYVLTIGLSALAFAGCSTTSNTNVNANLRNANSNVAVVVNNNTNVTTTNTNRWTNSNVNREDYNKNRADYERDKGDSTIGQGVNDSWLWFKTRSALMTTNDLRDSTINVDVVNDVVTLRGTVGSAAEKTKAEQVAKGIDGVKSVKNELKVSANDSVTNQMVNGNTRSNSNTNK